MSRPWQFILVGMVSLLGAGIATRAAAQQPQPGSPKIQVVATIKPVHSIVAAVMQGVATPKLLIDGVASPHTFTLKPSDAKALGNADIVFRVSESLEPFTVKLAEALPKRVRLVTLEKTPGLNLHKIRTGSTFESHDHGKGHGHGHKHAGHEDGIDGHIWLDPMNVKVLAKAIAETLAVALPAEAGRFRGNVEAFNARVDALIPEIETAVKPLAGKNYLVFHDAYQYFERRFGLQPVGSVTVSPEVPASARRIAALRRKVADLKVECIFAEPQFAPKVIDPIVEGSTVRRGVLDPLGAAITAGPDHYVTLIKSLSNDLHACLAKPS